MDIGGERMPSAISAACSAPSPPDSAFMEERGNTHYSIAVPHGRLLWGTLSARGSDGAGRKRGDMIIESLLDTDLYKLTMMQVVAHRFPFVDVEYAFKCRSGGVDLRPYRAEIEEQIDALCALRFTADELAYLRSIYYLNNRFIDSLERFELPRDAVRVFEEGEQLALRVEGNWFQTILFEVPLLAIINETYFRHRSDAVPKGGRERLDRKIELLTSDPQEPFKLIEFGTRRRY